MYFVRNHDNLGSVVGATKPLPPGARSLNPAPTQGTQKREKDCK